MYRSLTLLSPEELADDVSSLLFEYGAAGVEVEDSSLRPAPGRDPLPAGRARLTAYFSPENMTEGLADDVCAITGEDAVIETRSIPEQDWNAVWKSHFSPIEVSPRLWVCPSWRLGETPPGARVLVLDPGMAFGTGTHATTSLCLGAIDAHLAAHPGLDVLDVGTGSGILAIAAKLLGAGRVVGTDNDPVAVRVAQENAEINRVSIELAVGTLEIVTRPYPLVVANIMAGTLVDLARPLSAVVAPGGHLLLSGILDFQANDVEAAYVACGLEPVDRKIQGEWVLLHLRRP